MRIISAMFLTLSFLNCGYSGGTKIQIQKDGSGEILFEKMIVAQESSNFMMGDRQIPYHTLEYRVQRKVFKFKSINDVQLDGVKFSYLPETQVIRLKTAVGIDKGIFKYIGMNKEEFQKIRSGWNEYFQATGADFGKVAEFNPYYIKIYFNLFEESPYEFTSEILSPNSLPTDWKLAIVEDQSDLMNKRFFHSLLIPFSNIELDKNQEIEIEFKRK